MVRSCLAAILIAVSGCGAALPNYDYSKETDPRRSEYVIGVGDVLQVRVWKNPEVSTDPIVRPDGTITLTLLGDMPAAGLTPTQLRDQIKARFDQYIRDEAAVVTVAVSTVGSYRVTVSGRVAMPGVLSAAHFLTVVEAVSLAGGPTPFASPEDTVLFRLNPDGSARRVPIRYDLIVKGEHPEMNLVLKRGDQVFVP
ncbi:MAG: polysaccharide biosynthesis/export family protein [Myxococcales bacterium]